MRHFLKAVAWAISTAFAVRGAPVITQLTQAPRTLAVTSVAVSPTGDIYAALQSNTIARVNPANGTWTTIAGGGDDSSDGIPAMNAALAAPARIIFDASGRAVVSENARVRRIDLSSGIITTIAGTTTSGFSGDGGPANQAQLNYPVGIAYDARGNLFIADSGNRRVRRVDAQTGTITTVLGGWPADYTGSIGSPNDVAIAPNGDLAVSSPTLARVWRMDSTGVVSVYAGNGASYATPTGDGGTPEAATLCYPTSLKFDSHGSLFIGDLNSFQCNGGVRRVDADTGVIQTFLTDNRGPTLFSNGTARK